MKGRLRGALKQAINEAYKCSLEFGGVVWESAAQEDRGDMEGVEQFTTLPRAVGGRRHE